jgi:hypothetical protein
MDRTTKGDGTMDRSQGGRRLRLVAGLALLGCTLLLGLQTRTATPAGAQTPPQRPKHQLQRGPILGPPPASKPQHKPTNMPSVAQFKAPAPKNPDPVDLQVLVISADGSEADLPAIKQTLDELGTPYQVYTANQHTSLDPRLLWDGNVHAYFQGVILTTGSLVYYQASTNSYPSAFADADWNTLWTFEATFGIRQVTWYTVPTTDYGFNVPAGFFPAGTDTTPPNPAVTASFTTVGAPYFSGYANTNTPVSIQYAFAYQYPPLTDGATTTLLQDGSGNALGAIRSYTSQNRSNLALTFDSNPSLTHDLVLAYGVIKWVTKGLLLGERHVYLDAQPDDILIDDSIWQPATPCNTAVDDPSLPIYRITGSDLQAFINWQKAKQAQPTSTQLMIEFPFNGYGTTSAYYQQYLSGQNGTILPGTPSTDTLTPVVKQNQALFKWVSHTYDHENLDNATYAFTANEITQNNKVAAKNNLDLTSFSKANLVTPDISGLSNPAALQAMADNAVRNVVGDTSRWPNPSPNAGIYLSGSYVLNGVTKTYNVLEIPRHPTNLYFNVATPDQWLAEDNCLYGPNGRFGTFGGVTSYQQLLDRESTVLLGYLLRGDIDPLMFHQSNMTGYNGTQSLLGDLIDATLQKYNSLFTLPILSQTEDRLGQRMANRMQYNAAGVRASVVPGTSITLTATQAATVPVTGLSTPSKLPPGSTTETYGGQTITYVKLAAGQSVTLMQSTYSSTP